MRIEEDITYEDFWHFQYTLPGQQKLKHIFFLCGRLLGSDSEMIRGFVARAEVFIFILYPRRHCSTATHMRFFQTTLTREAIVRILETFDAKIDVNGLDVPLL